MHSASRTDAGVHARGQAVHFDLDRSSGTLDGTALARSINALCPHAVRVTDVEEADEADSAARLWHARLWASGKLYSYRLSTGAHWDPLELRWRHHVCRGALDVDAMNEAATHLLGRIDCAAFANRRPGEPPPQEMDQILTRRVVRSVQVVDEGGGRLRVDFHVQSALYKMVRNIVGMLVAIGSHRIGPDDVPRLISARDRTLLPGPAPAHGLTLESVYYEQGWGGRYAHPLHVGSRPCEGLERDSGFTS